MTPLPPNASPPSRSSTASNSPVDAPEGTAARPAAPDSSPTSTSTVGLPRLSITWRAWTCLISLTRFALLNLSADARRASSGSTRASRASATQSNSSIAESVEAPVEGLEAFAQRAAWTSSAPGVLAAGPGRGPPQQLARVEQRRAGSRARRRKISLAVRPGSVRLIWSQLRSTVGRVVGLGVAEHVRVAADQLRRQCSATAARSPWPRSSSSSDRK